MKKHILKSVLIMMMVTALSLLLVNNNKDADAAYVSVMGNSAITLKKDGTMTIDGTRYTEVSDYVSSDGLSGLFYSSDKKAFIMHDFSYYCTNQSSPFIVEDGVTLLIYGTNIISNQGKELGTLTTGYIFNCLGSFTIDSYNSDSSNTLTLELTDKVPNGAIINAPYGTLTIKGEKTVIKATALNGCNGFYLKDIDYQNGTTSINVAATGASGYCQKAGLYVKNDNLSSYITGGKLSIDVSDTKYADAIYMSASGDTDNWNGRLYMLGGEVYATAASYGCSIRLSYTEFVSNHDEWTLSGSTAGTRILYSASYQDTNPTTRKSLETSLVSASLGYSSDAGSTIRITSDIYQDSMTFTTIHTASELINLFKNGGNGHLSSDIDVSDTDGALSVADGKTVNLCLGGRTLTAGINNIISGNLSIYDCTCNGSIVFSNKQLSSTSEYCFSLTNGGLVTVHGGTIKSDAGANVFSLENGSQFTMLSDYYNMAEFERTSMPSIVADKTAIKMNSGSYAVLKDGNISNYIEEGSSLAKDESLIVMTQSGSDTTALELSSTTNSLHITNNYDGYCIKSNGGTIRIDYGTYIQATNSAAVYALHNTTVNFNAGVITTLSENSNILKTAAVVYYDGNTMNLGCDTSKNVSTVFNSASGIDFYICSDSGSYTPITVTSALYNDENNPIGIYSTYASQTIANVVTGFYANNSSKDYKDYFEPAKEDEVLYYFDIDSSADTIKIGSIQILKQPDKDNQVVILGLPSESVNPEIQWYKLDDSLSLVAVEGQTSVKFTKADSGMFVCKITYAGVSLYSDYMSIPLCRVSFLEADGTELSSYTAVYKKGIITQPQDPVKSCYIFVGWCTDDTLSTGYVFGDVITDDVTLYASWTMKSDATLDKTIQAYSYDGKTHCFILKDLPDGAEESSYNISYFDEDGNALGYTPGLPGFYTVHITREEDSLYKPLDVTIDQGLYIMRHKITIDDIENCASSFVYNGADQKDGLSYKYKNISGDYIDLKLTSVKIDDEAKDFINAGTYTLEYGFATEDENALYTFYSNCDTDYFYSVLNSGISKCDEDINYITTISIDKAEAVISTENLINTATYNGSAITFNDGAALNHSETELVYMDNTYTEPGTYIIKIVASETLNYYSKEETAEVTILKIKLNDPVVTGEYTYNGSEQTADVTGYDSSLIRVSNEKKLTQTDAGTYKLEYVIIDQNHYEWAEDSTGTIRWIINKAQSVITVDESEITIPYGGTPEIPVATSNYGKVTMDALNLDVYTLGEHKVTYTVEEDTNWLGSTKEITVVVVKASYNLRGISFNSKTFIYDGTPKNIYIGGNLPDGVTVTYTGNGETEAGIYTVTASFTGDEYHEEIKDLTAVLSIRNGSLESRASDTKPYIVVECTNGFDADVCLDSKVYDALSGSDSGNLLVDYSSILDDSEKLAFVYSISLYYIDDNGNKIYLQPSDLESGSTLTIKLLIPSTVDRKSIRRIIHVHSADDVSAIDYNSDDVFDGYYEFTVSKLSEFALVVENTDASTNSNKKYIYYIGAAGVAIILLGVIITPIAIKKKKKKHSKKH